MKTTAIIYNHEKDKAIRFYHICKDYLLSKNVNIISNNDYNLCDFIIVIGGDGTLLRCSRMVADIKKPILAVNMGNLGFLTDVKEEESFSLIDSILCGDYSTEDRYFLNLSYNCTDYFALNDIVITKSNLLARMIKIKIFANDVFVNTYRADGIIISSPTGSTAYNLSAGGPIIKPDLKAIVITPIAPHTLTARPIVLGGSDKLCIQLDAAIDSAQIVLDGQINLPLTVKDIITVQLSDKYIKLIKPPHRNYFAVLREKLKWGDDILD